MTTLARVCVGRVAMPILIGLLAVASVASALDRYGDHARHFAQGPKAELAAASFFGTASHEEFVGVQSLPDGRVVVYGNSWGPPFPPTPGLRTVGLDSVWDCALHEEGMSVNKDGSPRPPAPTNPNRTGFMLTYAPDLSAIRASMRFGWGIASISGGLMLRDGALIIAGTCTPKFRTIAKTAGYLGIRPRDPANTKTGPYMYNDLELPGDTYAARLSPDLSKLEWVWIFEGHRTPPEKVFEGKGGEVFVETAGLKRISADGRTVTDFAWKSRGDVRLGGSLQLKLMTVSPFDSTVLYGGDHQSGTGREPWRKPIVLGFTPDGELKWRLYDFDGPLIGHDRYRLVSDSALRVAAFSEKGELAMSFWSDGGNTILNRNPIDLDRPVEAKGVGMSPWGSKGAKSYCHIVRFNPETCDPVFYSFWAAYMSEEPNSITVSGMLALRAGATAVWGGSASYVVQTPNAFYSAGDRPGAGRGTYFTIFNPSFDNVYFSSAMPCAGIEGMADGVAGLVVVSTVTAAAEPAEKGGSTVPVKGALQSAFGGGLGDGHVLLMKLPGAK